MAVLSSNATRNTAVQVMLPARLIDILNSRAIDRGLSRSAFIRDALERALFTDTTPSDVAGAESTTTMKEAD